jgi:hypothetical protein
MVLSSVSYMCAIYIYKHMYVSQRYQGQGRNSEGKKSSSSRASYSRETTQGFPREGKQNRRYRVDRHSQRELPSRLVGITNVGRVIGPKGAHINFVRNYTGATIDVQQAPPSSIISHANVKITGSTDDIVRKAKKMIMLLDDSGRGRWERPISILAFYKRGFKSYEASFNDR